MITDPFLEFVVVDNDQGDGKMEQSDDYWEKRYHLEESKCPIFLRKMMNEILKAGKYLNVIRECGKDISMVAVSTYFLIFMMMIFFNQLYISNCY